jgi:hypothetical protein
MVEGGTYRLEAQIEYLARLTYQGFEPNTTIANGYTVYESILNGYYDEMTPITTTKPYSKDHLTPNSSYALK